MVRKIKLTCGQIDNLLTKLSGPWESLEATEAAGKSIQQKIKTMVTVVWIWDCASSYVGKLSLCKLIANCGNLLICPLKFYVTNNGLICFQGGSIYQKYLNQNISETNKMKHTNPHVGAAPHHKKKAQHI